MRKAGVMVSKIEPNGYIIKIRPPLVFQPEHADQLLTTLDDVPGRALNSEAAVVHGDSRELRNSRVID